MMGLLNNVDYVCASFVFSSVLIIAGRNRYAKISRSNRLFYLIVAIHLMSCGADILLNFAKTYTDVFGPVWMNVFRLFYNVGFCSMDYMTYRYLRSYIDRDRVIKGRFIPDYIAAVDAALFALLSVINVFTGIITYADENGQYTLGPFYNLVFIMPIILIILNAVVPTIYRKCFTKSQYIAIISMCALSSFCTLIEMIIDSRVLLAMFGASLATLIMQLSLETPDYSKMMDTIVKLEQSRAEAETARIEADRANRAKSDFLARMSHEIRTPMNAIMGMNEIIMKTTEDEAARGYASDAYNAATGLLGTINEILDFSKIESGKMELVEDKYSARSLFGSIYTMFAMKAEAKNVALMFDVDNSIPDGLFGDELRIRQIITNLLSNAVKYTEQGTITLKAYCVSRTQESVRISYEISDTGRGIKQEDLKVLFEAFERIDEKNNRNVEGTGLGMNIVSKLIMMMGSTLGVRSEYGKGSVFSFVLEQKVYNNEPVGDFRKAVQESKNSSEKPMFVWPEGHVLVVDDNAVNLKVIGGLLKSTEMKIVPVTSGEEALKASLRKKFDIIFLDHFMPGMDGIETLKALREQEDGKNRDSVIVALTANAVNDAAEEYARVGFDDTVYKPATQSDLNEVLWKFFRSRVSS